MKFDNKKTLDMFSGASLDSCIHYPVLAKSKVPIFFELVPLPSNNEQFVNSRKMVGGNFSDSALFA